MLLTVAVGNWNDNHIEVLSLETGRREPLIPDASVARYVPTGHLIFPRDEVLYALPFDVRRLEKTGEERPVLSDVMMDYDSGRVARYAVSPSVIMAYLPVDRKVRRNQLHWVNRQEGKISLDLPDVYYRNPAVSPDGTRIAYCFRAGHRENIGIYDTQRKVPTTLTRAGSSNIVPVWHPDHKQIAFCSNREGQWNLWIQAADGSNEARRLHPSKFIEWPSSWSPDGRYLLFVRRLPDGTGIYLLDVNRPDAQPIPLSEAGAQEQHARFSPDGRLIAFTDTSQQAVKVMKFAPDNPRRGRTHNVSASQVSEPVWSPRGDRLYYRTTDGTRIFSVPIMAGPSLRIGTKGAILDDQTLQAWTTSWGSSYDLMPKGERFIALLLDTPSDKATTLVVILNWFEELRQKLAAGK